MVLLIYPIVVLLAIQRNYVIGCEHTMISGFSSNNSSFINSPMFPNAFPDGPYTCKYTIKNTANGTIALNFVDFITQSQLNYDYHCSEEIYIYEDSNKNAQHFCSNIAVMFTSVSSTVTVEFNVKGPNDYQVSGFKAYFDFIEEHISNDSENVYYELKEEHNPRKSYMKNGYIDSYKDPFGIIQRHLDTNSVYIWVIRALKDHIVRLLITEPILEEDVILTDSKFAAKPDIYIIEIRDGLTSEGRLLYTAAGNGETTFHITDTVSGGMYVRLEAQAESFPKTTIIAKYTSILRIHDSESCLEGYNSCFDNSCVGQTAVCEDDRFCGDVAMDDDVLCGDHYGGFCRNNNDCKNSAYCFGKGSYCFCKPGFDGNYCEYHITDCIPSCMNGGVCENGACECPRNYSGRRCDVAIEILEHYTWIGYFIGGLTYAGIITAIGLVVTKRIIKYKRNRGSTGNRRQTAIELQLLPTPRTSTAPSESTQLETIDEDGV